MSLPSFALRRRILVAAGALVVPRWAAARSPLPRSEGASEAQLATVFTGQVDPSRCFVSEKYDGVRAVWDGRVLRHRSGRAVAAPAPFLAALPALPLDGELWLGRGSFERLSAIVRRRDAGADDWRPIRYMIFDLPIAAASFEARLERLQGLALGGSLELAPQWRVADRAELDRTLQRTVAAGGEGLMLHVATAPYAAGRSDALLKLKPHRDAEAVVVGHRAGSGKYRGSLGAIEVQSPAGRRFFIGSGFSDAARREPPPIGSTITYRYRDLTSTGLPRFATYLRRHDDL
jgi:DNA ligase